MSAPNRLITDVLPPGRGRLLDLGAGREGGRQAFQALGYAYISLDIDSKLVGVPMVLGDAHRLPFVADTFDVVVSKDTLEHFAEPGAVIAEVTRVLRPSGLFAVWVPFMHGFHASDYYRYTPLGLRYLLRHFEILRLDSPRGLIAMFGTVADALLRRLKLAGLGRLIEACARRIDGLIMRFMKQPSALAAGYRVLARKRDIGTNTVIVRGAGTLPGHCPATADQADVVK